MFVEGLGTVGICVRRRLPSSLPTNPIYIGKVNHKAHV
jgi:hypothetical protein